MLTRNAAIATGVADETGVLAPGMAADLVMLDGDPFADIDAVLVVKGDAVVSDQR